MGLRVKTNIPAEIAVRRLDTNRKNLDASLERLASGLRINRASDDAAGLAISERMLAKIKSLDVAKRNANDGVSYLEVAESGLSLLSNVIIRMRELTTQAATDTIGPKEREYLNQEFTELGKEALRIKDQTEFNGRRIFDDENDETLGIQVGVNFRSVDYTDETAEQDVIKIDFGDIGDLNQAIQDLSEASIEGDLGSELGGDTNDIYRTLDDAIDVIASSRATLGAVQSRMFSTMDSIEVSRENVNAAQSRIRDVDFASESAVYAKAKILAAASTSVLAQTNQLPEDILPLLRGL